jgi:hypothetical protein
MRLVGTAAICAALAFGAAFLVGRAVGHNGRSTALKLSSATVGHQTASDPQLASEFTPSFTAVKLRRHVKIHHLAKGRHAAAPHSASTTQSSSTGSTVTRPTIDTAPAYVAPANTPPATTTQHSSSSGQGSGTTSVGGSGSKKKGSGTGTTSVGG